MTAHSVFTLDRPLPAGGHNLIEASAGTGKTFALSALAARYVAEANIPIDKILIVTFTRMAAAELRDRVRARISELVVGLGSDGPDDTDELVVLLAQQERNIRLRRLERALATFDAATITTIHGFAQQALATLGSASVGDLEATLLENTSELLRSVCADVLTLESATNPGFPEQLPDFDDFVRTCNKVLSNPGIRVIPAEDQEAPPGAARVARLVRRVVELAEQRRRSVGVVSFDDLLVQLRSALDGRPAAAANLRRRFQVALIDEFQDTDPVQWEIFSRLFPESDRSGTLVLVGDPKQAIYSFRGANIHTYLRATRLSESNTSTLATNWRSDGALVDALGTLLAGATFGDESIRFLPVEACDDHLGLRITSEQGGTLPALSLRLVGDHLPRTAKGDVRVPDALKEVNEDLAQEVVRLLEVASVPDVKEACGRRRLEPKDVAVLVLRRNEAEPIQQALRGRGIPAVCLGGQSVFESPAALQWRYLLAALERPSEAHRARMAALSWFFGWTAAELDQRGDEALDIVHERLASWAEALSERGVVEMCAQVWAESAVAKRLLAQPDGERNVTDLDHIAGLLVARGQRSSSVTSLVATLDRLQAAALGDPEDDVTARQVESEAAAVQIMTVHLAKGLEFPVVCVPTLWRNFTMQEIVFQDPLTDERTVDVAKEKWPSEAEAAERRSLAESESLGEQLRLLYVAVTRARHATLLWWTRASNAAATALARVLYARTGLAIDPELFSAPRVILPSQGDATFLQPLFAPIGDRAQLCVAPPAFGTAKAWAPPRRTARAVPLQLAATRAQP